MGTRTALIFAEGSCLVGKLAREGRPAKQDKTALSVGSNSDARVAGVLVGPGQGVWK